MLTPTHLSDLSLNAMQSEMDLPQVVLIFHVLLSWRPSQPKCRGELKHFVKKMIIQVEIVVTRFKGPCIAWEDRLIIFKM